MDTLPGGHRAHKTIHKIKTAVKDTLLPCSMFEDMGFTYLGPVDGHNTEEIENLLKGSKELKIPVLIHAVTIKGKGYEFSDIKPEDYHGISSFNIKNGKET
jgi:1-deoxy-D-xylulose-5-phosphate synthase